ncbi:MAG TPA: hypothetical protein VFV38_13120 [Ktedonobacteraceae bacterium]|nr:hypothetical protein [Ktedonobacteraceae bacterium]
MSKSKTRQPSDQSSVSVASKPLSRDAAKYERRQAERQSRFLAQRRARRIRNTIITIVALVVVLGGSLTAYLIYNAQNSKAQGPTTAAPFQEPIFDSDFQPIDNVYCDQLEGSVEHIHAHLTIYINGQQSPLPANVGIPINQQSGQATCFYWLHVHSDTPGIIHIEAPTKGPFTLGQFLDEWDQGFQVLGFPSELLLDSGWTIWVNGQVYKGSLASVPLSAHNLITIAYNSPKAKPDTTFNWGTL